VGDEEEREDSVIFATTGGRGGDCSMLHVSEWGPIAAEDAARSNEIRSGAFPAARMGRRVVETTWKGGKGGDLWELVKPIMEKDPNAEGVIYFFPWHDDPAAIRTDGMVTDEVEHYFRELSGKLGKKFNPEQKKWWAAKKIEQGVFMNREYPSTLEEAFRSAIEGAVFARKIDEARSEGRIMPMRWSREHPVFTFWDLGSMRNTRCTYVQFVGTEIWIIDHDDGSVEMTPTERVSYMNAKGYSYEHHFLPHDAAAEEKSGKNFQQQLTEAGLKGIRIIPKCREIWPGINKAIQILPRCVFDSVRCERLVESLEQYHTKKSSVDGHITDVIVANWACHSADTFRMIAEALLNSMLKDFTSANRHSGHQDRQRERQHATAGKYKRR
jgi:hypothetical protein